jgi:hypothetical protein
MGTRTITRIIYNFRKPENPISEEEYFHIKNNPIEIYPQEQSAFLETFKEYPFYITIFILTSWTIFLPLLGIISGGVDEPYSYYKMIKKKNEFYFRIYKTIYETKDYEQFCSNYKKI